MSEIIPFPAKPVPEPQPPRHSGRQLWLMKTQARGENGQGWEALVLDAKIHAVCDHLKRWERHITDDEKRLGRCKRCPRWREDTDYGRLQDGCYMLAEGFVALALCGDQFEPEPAA